MTIKSRLADIKTAKYLHIPKKAFEEWKVVSVFGEITNHSDKIWFVPCKHDFGPPASEKAIAETEKQLGFVIPDSYKTFLRLADGAKIFAVSKDRSGEHALHVRFRLFSCEELVQMNRFCLETFREAFRDDSEYASIACLNYMAFCDATNDNYQALITSGPQTGQVFLLFNEFQCRPYAECDADFYYTIADSFEEWLSLIVCTGGWEGRGIQSGSL